jgi:ATP-dependent protease ClpP protease subunit
MSKIAYIMIAGPIGKFKFQGQEVKGIELKDVIAQVTRLDDDVEELWVQYDSIGGVRKVGKSIYNYLMSLKPRYKIVSEQLGMVASTATEPWFAGDRRIATRGEKFAIHNPWLGNVTGDGDDLIEAGTEAKKQEAEMAAFYVDNTGITEAGIRPLMKEETTFGDELAVDLGFATELQEAHKIAAYMKKQNEDKLNAVLAAIKGFFLGDAVLNMVADLADGKKIAFATEDLSKLEGVAATTVDDAGNPTTTAPLDGVYPLKDGRKVTIAAGKVASVEGTPAAPPADVADVAEGALALQLDAVLAAVKSQKDLKAELMAALKAEMIALRTEIKGNHIPAQYEATKEAELIAEWERSFKANEHLAMRRDNPEKFKALFFARYKKLPNL